MQREENFYPSSQKEMQADRTLLLDVRTPAEFEAKHIAGSYNIPLDQLEAHKDSLARQAGDARIQLICQSGTRARQAAEVLKATSLTSVSILEGGIAACEKAGEPLVRGVQKWSLERQVRGVAGSLVLLGILGGQFIWPPLIWIAALIGAGLAYSAASNTCGMAMLLSKLPYNQGATCNVRDTLKNIANLTS